MCQNTFRQFVEFTTFFSQKYEKYSLGKIMQLEGRKIGNNSSF
jgi:hypothetical protein